MSQIRRQPPLDAPSSPPRGIAARQDAMGSGKGMAPAVKSAIDADDPMLSTETRSNGDGRSLQWVGRLGKARWADGKGPKVIDLCAGCGGLTLGFRSVGFQVVAAAEIDSVAAMAHRKNFPNVTLFGPGSESTGEGDITKLTGGQLLAATGLEPGQLDVLIGGIPCQGFSEIGRRRCEDPRNVLYQHFVRLVGDLRPKAFLIENVPAMTWMHGGKQFDDLISSLERLGYSATQSLVNAATYGVPQMRTRLLVAGTLTGQKITFPQGPRAVEQYVTVDDAIGDLPDDLSHLPFRAAPAQPYRASATSTYARLLRGDGTLVNRLTPTEHTPELQARLSALLPGGIDPPTRHRRLDACGQAWTIRAGARARTACRPIHPTQPRVINVREAARLHSVPDEFWLPEVKSGAHMVIGNSVAPLMAHHLADLLAQQAFADEMP